MSSLGGKKVLITGATGFIGANLVRRAIVAGADVSIITRKSSDTWRIMDKLECVSQYHSAAYGGNPAQKDIWNIIESNDIGTVNLVNACKKVDFELFVNTDSSSEYGIKALPIGEEDFREPVNDYKASKSAATLYSQFAARSEKIPIVILRLFSPYGCYEKQTVELS